MNHQLIINTLKKYPDMTAAQVALMINVDLTDILKVQREYYRSFIKRDSPLWDMLPPN